MFIIQMAYIFLPISFFGGIGWFADTLGGSEPLFLLIGIGIAFFATNILFYFQFRTLSFEMDKISLEGIKKKEKNSDQNY